MTERPILFSAPMVRAILEGRKSQTRRVVTPQPPTPEQVHALAGIDYSWIAPTHQRIEYHRPAGPVWAVRALMGREPHLRCPYGHPGDRLWVREAWGIAAGLPWDPGYVEYRADCTGNFNDVGDLIPRWRPSTHMPRKYSRILLEVTDVRVQRVQDISEADARAEGVLWVPGHGEITPADLEEGYSNYLDCRQGFWGLWDSINERRGYGWEANPWVWCLTFKRVDEAKG